MADLTTLKDELFNYVDKRLGGGIVDVELDPDHYEVAYDKALSTYRQRAQNAYEESYNVVELQENQNTYTLPTEVSSVRQVFRRTMGDSTGPYSSSFNPFSSATLNVYLLNYSQAGGLATYDMYTQYVEMAARMFGGYMNYTFNPVTKVLSLVRDPKSSGEQILLWTYNQKPEIVLLQDNAMKQWLRDYTFAASKMIIGEAREKFASIAGPQGGTALNGASLKAESQAEMDRLIDELATYTDHSQPLTWIIG
jgi:hypothetical protein